MNATSPNRAKGAETGHCPNCPFGAPRSTEPRTEPRTEPFTEPRVENRAASGAPTIALNPETASQDIARLALGLMAFLREVMEFQAIRRMEAGRLTPEQEEALGLTLMRSEEAIHEVAARFGLSPADLALDLGPLGRLTTAQPADPTMPGT